MAAVQLAMDVDDPVEAKRDREREIERQQELLSRFFKACREVCREQTYERAANELDDIWAPLGRGVSPSVLKATLSPGNERNYFRWEWAIWFATQSEDVADLLCEVAGRGKPKKSPEEELRDLQNIVRSEYPKQAERLIRKAGTP
jgi:hypothetical protein